MQSTRATVLANLTLIGAGCLVHSDSMIWLIRSLFRPDSELNLILAIGLGGLILWHTDYRAVAARMTRPPDANPVAALLVVLGAAGLAQNAVNLEPAYACFAGIGAYGLAGLYVPRQIWIRARPVAALAILLMPMSEYLDIYLGFPARRFTAEAVAGLLGLLNISHVTSGMVLTLEGGAAYVDLPCAGIRSLWTGAVFLLGATMLDGNTLDRWFGFTAVVFTGLLLVANTARVAAIVLIELVAGQPLLAEILHAPMGVIGFVACCAVGWGLLSRSESPGVAPLQTSRTPLMWALVPALLVLGTLPTPAAEAHVAVAVSLPAGFDAIALTDAEVSLATEQGGSIAKAQFQRGEISGTVVLVTSGSWLAQHLPRHCLRAAGVALTGEFPTLVDGEPIRWAEIATNGHSGRAAWWFQSADHITDDHTERIWLGMGDDTPWTLVSIVIDQPVQPDHPEVVTLVTDLRSHLLESL